MAVLKGDADGFVHWMGIQCSTWIGTSRGSTGRSKSNPLGVDSESNRRANLMTARRLLRSIMWSTKSSWYSGSLKAAGTKRVE